MVFPKISKKVYDSLAYVDWSNDWSDNSIHLQADIKNLNFIEFWIEKISSVDIDFGDSELLIYSVSGMSELIKLSYIPSKNNFLLFDNNRLTSSIEIPITVDLAEPQHFTIFYNIDDDSYEVKVNSEEVITVKCDLNINGHHANSYFQCMQFTNWDDNVIGRQFKLGLRLWEIESFPDAKNLAEIYNCPYNDIPKLSDWSVKLLHLVLCDSGVYSPLTGKGIVSISPIGESEDFFSSEMLTPPIDKVTLTDTFINLSKGIGIIDFWVNPKLVEDGKPNANCIFEFSDGIRIGHSYGIYTVELTYGDLYNHYIKSGETISTNYPENPSSFDYDSRWIPIAAENPDECAGAFLAIKFSQLSFLLISRKPLIAGRYSYISILTSEHKISVNGGDYVKFIGNYFRNSEGLEIVQHDFSNYSIGCSIEGKCELKHKLVGPRFWAGQQQQQQSSAQYKSFNFAAYAYMDFNNLPVFGATDKQDEIYGVLKGLLIEETDKKGKKGTSKNLCLTPELSKNITHLPTGIDLELPDSRQIFLKKYAKEDCVMSFSMGEIDHPNALRQFIKGHPYGLALSDIGTIEFWIEIIDAKQGDETQTIFEIIGRDSSLESNPTGLIALDFTQKNKGLSLRRIPTTSGISETIELKSPPIIANKLHHFSLRFDIGLNNSNAIFMSTNGGPEIKITGASYFTNFEFDIESIIIASNNEGENCLNAKLCGPRFWIGEPLSNQQLNIIPFINYETSAKDLVFPKQRSLGNIRKPDISEYDIYTQKYINQSFRELFFEDGPLYELPDLEVLENLKTRKKLDFSFEVDHIKKSHYSDAFSDYFGSWVLEKHENTIPKLQELVDGEGNYIKREMHCRYEEARSISLSVNHTNHRIYLVLQTGEYLYGRIVNNTTIEFFNKKHDKECIVRFYRESFTVQKKDDYELVEYLFLRIKELGSALGIQGNYKKPYRKPVWSATEVSNIFLHRPPNFDSVMMGCDLTKLDPTNYFDFEATTGHAIFRLPPLTSSLVDFHQGVAIPFGWNYVPFVSYNSAKSSKFITTSKELEHLVSNSITHKKSDSNKISGSAGLKDVFGTNFSVEWGVNSESNRAVAERTRTFIEKQSFSAFQQWFCTSHDIVLDKPNALFTGQNTPDDDLAVFDPTVGFYPDIMRLKEAIVNGKSYMGLYKRIIEKYGTHYISSVRFGSKGWRLHYFSQELKQWLLDKKVELSYVEGQKVAVGGGLTGGMDGFSGSLNAQVDSVESDGTSYTGSDKNDYKNMIKNEREESSSRGSYSESSVDNIGAIHVFRSLEPIYELLSPPFFNDFIINTQVRENLAKAFDHYIDSSKKDWPETTYTDSTYEVQVEVKVDFEIPIKPTDTELNKDVRTNDGVHQQRVDLLQEVGGIDDPDKEYNSINLTKFSFSADVKVETGTSTKRFYHSSEDKDLLAPVSWHRQGYVRKANWVCNGPSDLKIFSTDLESKKFTEPEVWGSFLDGGVVTPMPNKLIKISFSGILNRSFHVQGGKYNPWYKEDELISDERDGFKDYFNFKDEIHVDFTKSLTYNKKTKWGYVNVIATKIK